MARLSTGAHWAGGVYTRHNHTHISKSGQTCESSNWLTNHWKADAAAQPHAPVHSEARHCRTLVLHLAQSRVPSLKVGAGRKGMGSSLPAHKTRQGCQPSFSSGRMRGKRRRRPMLPMLCGEGGLNCILPMTFAKKCEQLINRSPHMPQEGHGLIFVCVPTVNCVYPPPCASAAAVPKVRSKWRFNAHPVLRQGRAYARGGGAGMCAVLLSRITPPPELTPNNPWIHVKPTSTYVRNPKCTNLSNSMCQSFILVRSGVMNFPHPFAHFLQCLIDPNLQLLLFPCIFLCPQQPS